MIIGRNILECLEDIDYKELTSYAIHSKMYKFNKHNIIREVIKRYKFEIVEKEKESGLKMIGLKSPAGNIIAGIVTNYEIDEDLARRYMKEIKKNLEYRIEKELKEELKSL